MDQRPLHQILCDVLGAPFPDGDDHCYYSPPDNLTMKYPCIRYSLEEYNAMYADNRNYLNWKKYSVMIIDEDPDSIYLDRLMKVFPNSIRLNRPYVGDGLYHYPFTLYFLGERIKEENQNESN